MDRFIKSSFVLVVVTRPLMDVCQPACLWQRPFFCFHEWWSHWWSRETGDNRGESLLPCRRDVVSSVGRTVLKCARHSCAVEPGSSLVSVCQRSTFLPLFFRQSIQCCRVSPCEWHPKETPPGRHRDTKWGKETELAFLPRFSYMLINRKMHISEGQHLRTYTPDWSILYCCIRGRWEDWLFRLRSMKIALERPNRPTSLWRHSTVVTPN